MTVDKQDKLHFRQQTWMADYLIWPCQQIGNTHHTQPPQCSNERRFNDAEIKIAFVSGNDILQK
jgi:hypothetical protein